MTVKKHKATGWTRTPIGYGNYRITPTDDSGERTVAFMSAQSWANLPNDNRDKIDQDRVVLIDGPALPAWALDWLEAANRRQCEQARDAFEAAMHDAEFNDPTWRDY